MKPKERGRKIFHVIVWCVVLGLYLWVEQFSYGTFFVVGLFFFFFVLDLLRLYFHVPLPFLSLLRKGERKRFFTPTRTMFGFAVAVLLFEQQLVVASFLMMIFGDFVAPLVGQYGHHWISLQRKKNWEGAGAEFVVDVMIGLLVVKVVAVAVVMALAATLVETFNQQWDDNMVIPPVASFAGTVIRFIA